MRLLWIALLPGCLLFADPPSSLTGTVPDDRNLSDVASWPVEVAVGFDLACARYEDERVRCSWGSSSAPAAAPDIRAQRIAVNDHACALDLDGLAHCWGFGSNGGMADAVPPAEPLSDIAPGVGDTCGIRASDGAIVCWGEGAFGESDPPPGAFTDVEVGRDVACGIRDDGSLSCWGSVANGLDTPPSGTGFVDLAVGFESACAVRDDDTHECWGAISSFEVPTGRFAKGITGNYFHFCILGDNSTPTCFGDDTSQETMPFPGPYTSVSAGWLATCGVHENGEILCWGDVADIGF